MEPLLKDTLNKGHRRKYLKYEEKSTWHSSCLYVLKLLFGPVTAKRSNFGHSTTCNVQTYIKYGQNTSVIGRLRALCSDRGAEGSNFGI